MSVPPRDRPRPDSVPADQFFAAPANAAPPPARLSRLPAVPKRFAWVLAGFGFLGTLVFSAPFLHQLVIGAPVFEEFLKFGLALALVLALKVREPVPRLVLALIPGAAFGVLEHYVTYSSEPLVYFADRVAFHSGASAASMATWTLVEPLVDTRVRWLATAPATLVHWLNNFLALFLGVGAVLVPQVRGAGLAIAITLAILMHAIAWTLTLAGPAWRDRIHAAWVARVTPEDRTRRTGPSRREADRRVDDPR